MFAARLTCLVALLGAGSLLGAPLKIACIGDSITEGSGLGNPAIESYPARLQRLLGTNHVVRNYGLSGRTLLKKGDYPYWKEAYFKQSHDWLPDIITIKLGTNDSKPHNWRYGTNFVAELEEFVASYAALASAPRILLCTPCPVFGAGVYEIKPGTVATNIAPALRDLAARLGLGLIDFHTRLAGHSEWFPDTVHPNSKGMTVMAAMVFDALAGGPPAAPLPSVEIARLSPTRTVLQWPSLWGGLVVQSAPALRPTNTAWTVVEQVSGLNGDLLRQTNSMSGTSRCYRLWQP